MASGGARLKEEYLPGKRKMMAMGQDTEAGMDELLSVLGYKVRNSDMANLAQKLELLDQAMGNVSMQYDSLLAHLTSDTVHYNPSDLSSWVENMLSDFNAPNPSALDHYPIDLSSWLGYPAEPARGVESDCGSEAHPGIGSRDWKRMRTSYSSSSSCSVYSGGLIRPSEVSPSVLPMIMADSDHEDGIRLIHALIACAEAIQQENYKSADNIY